MIAKISIVLACTVLLAGCGKSENPPASAKGEATAIETIFVKGDPNQLIDGSQRNQSSFINVSNVVLLNEYSLSHVIQYTEKAEIVRKEETESAETGNEAEDEDTTESARKRLYSFVKTSNDYSYVSAASDISFNFHKDENDVINLEGLVVKEDYYKLNPIHYSMKKSGDAFSILAEIVDTDVGRILIAFTFTKKSEAKKLNTVSSMYKYLFGPGVIVSWNQKENLEINICGQQSAAVEKAYRDGIKDWDEALSGRINVTTRTLISYPPFSDLNNHCIYTVKNYQTIYGNRFVNMASTILKGNLFKGNIIDADIMVWVKENEKYGVSLEQSNHLQAVTAHEVGHLLGLHHQFDKSIKSIMSYDDTAYITDYDKTAVGYLYPRL